VILIPVNHRQANRFLPSLCAAQRSFPDLVGPFGELGGESGTPIEHMLKKR
jgi:hypothetical protein